MSLFKQNTENALSQKLKSLDGAITGWTACLFTAHKLPVEKRRRLLSKEVQQRLVDFIYTEGVLIYFFRDGDMIFLFQGLRRQMLELIQGELVEIFPEFSPENVDIEGYLEFFTLSEDMEEIQNLIRSKEVAYQQHKKRLAAAQKEGNAEAMPSWSSKKFTAAAASRPNRQKPTILVVDDDPLITELARAILHKTGKIHTAHSYEQALEIYSEIAPDMAFLDIQIAEDNGLQLLEQLINADPQGRFVMLTSEKKAVTVRKAIDLGAVGYVAKPFAAHKVLESVKKFLS